jgi:hypothetical protein
LNHRNIVRAIRAFLADRTSPANGVVVRGRRRDIGTADFDPLRYVSVDTTRTPQAVESLI